MNTYFEMWIADKQSIIQTMKQNIEDDLRAGYDPNGSCITRQKVEIGYYEKKFDSELKSLRTMTEKQAERWCKIDLIRRGAIEI